MSQGLDRSWAVIRNSCISFDRVIRYKTDGIKQQVVYTYLLHGQDLLTPASQRLISELPRKKKIWKKKKEWTRLGRIIYIFFIKQKKSCQINLIVSLYYIFNDIHILTFSRETPLEHAAGCDWTCVYM